MFKKVIRNIILLLSVYLPYKGGAQELNCTVQVVSAQIQDASSLLVFKNMQDAIYQFMNSTKWTNDNFTTQERIECTIFINLSPGANSISDFTGTMTVQSRRPVYKSSYNSAMMNYQDNNIHIVYQLNQPLIFNINTYTDNITSLLAFYAYMIIGYDYDTFSMNGGSPYFLKAQNIVNNAQNSGEKGWNPQDGDQTRYFMVSNALDETFFGPLRKAMYDYHRLGLDVMYTDVEKGRQEIISSLQLVQQVFNARPSNFNVLLFFNAKADEIANIFSQAPDAEKNTVLPILNAIDATDADKFTKLKTD